MPHVMSVPKFERFFRTAASLDIDKADIARFDDFIDRDYSHETEARLPDIAGGLSVALAHVIRLIDPESKHPFGEQWERATRVFDELM